jgi:1-acyl-sn-glycerol-3-phosphate acyltransferase
MYTRSLPRRIYYWVAQFLCRCLCLTLFPLRFHGHRHLPRSGGVLIVSNHQSFMDPVFLGVTTSRRMNFVARKTLQAAWLYRLLAGPLDPIDIDQEGISLSGIKETLRRLHSGEVVAIHPEGARTPDGRMHPFLRGFLLLARRAKVPILPLGLAGGFRAWPRFRLLPRPAHIEVVYGAPIAPEQYLSMSDEELVQTIYNRLREVFEQAARLRQLRSGSPVARYE